MKRLDELDANMAIMNRVDDESVRWISAREAPVRLKDCMPRLRRDRFGACRAIRPRL